MKLSVILPTYNQEKYLAHCLDSLLDQGLSPSDYEIIIVNDGSTDGTEALANAYANQYPQIKVLTKPNGGAGAARNAGMDIARGTWLHFVDPDDYIARRTYPTLLALAESHQLDILGFIFRKTTRNDLTESQTPADSVLNTPLDITTGEAYIATNNYRNTVWWYLINRDFMKRSQLRFIEGRWMEDSILTPTLFLKSKRMARVELDVYRYMIRPNSAMTSKSPEHYNKLIGDIEQAAFAFDELLASIPGENPVQCAAKKRIKTRQQSFVFFLLVRLMKSNLPIELIPIKLRAFKSIQAYPLDHFGGQDFKGPAYSTLTWVFNKEPWMIPFMRTFRAIYRPASRFISR